MIAQPTVIRGLALAALLHVGALAVESAEPNPLPVTVELRGRVVCVAEEMHRRHAAPLPADPEHPWGLRAADGKLYTLLRGRFSIEARREPLTECVLSPLPLRPTPRPSAAEAFCRAA
jgi:hypothetical protein